jgi:hypothetical protein
MISRHLFLQHHDTTILPTASSSSTGQALPASAPAPITDLNCQFVLTIGDSAGPSPSLVTFVVPPRMRTMADTVPDAHIIQTFQTITGNPAQWRLVSADDAQGGRMLTVMPQTGQSQAPLVTFCIRHDNALQSLTIDVSGTMHVVGFEQKLPSQPSVPGRAPRRLIGLLDGESP